MSEPELTADDRIARLERAIDHFVVILSSYAGTRAQTEEIRELRLELAGPDSEFARQVASAKRQEALHHGR